MNDVDVNTRSWSDRARVELGSAPVRPLEREPASAWERELVELSGGRGLPIVGGVSFGCSTAQGGGPPAGEPFGVSNVLGPLWLRAEDGSLISSDGRYVSRHWRDWIERLVRAAAFSSYPPPLTLLGPSTRTLDALPEALIARLGLTTEFELGPLHSIYVADNILVMSQFPQANEPYRVRARDAAAVKRVLDAAGATDLLWYFDSHALADATGPLAAHRDTAPAVRASDFGTLRVSVNDRAIEQCVDGFGLQLEQARFEPEGAARVRPVAQPSGSDRVRRWCDRRGVLRVPLELDSLGVERWVRERGVPHGEVLLRFEKALGGLIAPSPDDPIQRPHLALGLGVADAAPAALVSCWHATPEDYDELLSDPDTRDPSVPHGRGVWSWGKHSLVAVGEWWERVVLVDDRGAIWRWDEFACATDVAAAAPETLIERLALDEQLIHEWRDFALTPVRLLGGTAELAEHVAGAVGLSAVDELSDDLVRHFAGEALWMRQIERYGPNRAEIVVLTPKSQRAVDAARAARDFDPRVPVRVWSSLAAAYAHTTALVAAGLSTATELVSPG